MSIRGLLFFPGQRVKLPPHRYSSLVNLGHPPSLAVPCMLRVAINHPLSFVPFPKLA